MDLSVTRVLDNIATIHPNVDVVRGSQGACFDGMEGGTALTFTVECFEDFEADDRLKLCFHGEYITSRAGARVRVVSPVSRGDKLVRVVWDSRNHLFTLVWQGPGHEGLRHACVEFERVEMATTILSNSDRGAFVDALQNPPPPTKSLRAASKRYRSDVIRE